MRGRCVQACLKSLLLQVSSIAIGKKLRNPFVVVIAFVNLKEFNLAGFEIFYGKKTL
jgi:hypothetical protein